MTHPNFIQIALYLLVLILLVKPIGLYMARVYDGKIGFLRPAEQFAYRLCGINSAQEMDWKGYLIAMLVFNLLGLLAVYAVQRLQFYLPFNPQAFIAVAPDLAFNTAASFATNTNWQNYGGENSLSYLTQMFALSVQNFISAATGMALLIALIRGFVRQETTDLGNFWVDTIRSLFYILIPMSFIFALVLVSQGVIQNLKPYQTMTLLEPIQYQMPLSDANGLPLKDSQGNPKTTTQQTTEQIIPMGPVASQIAIKQLGTNGGGFFNTNSAHPFENPNPLTNFLEMLATILLPAAFCYTFGVMVKDHRQGWAVFMAMLAIFIPVLLITVNAEYHGNPHFVELGIPGHENMEGKETRFGIVNSAIWAIATTASSNGSVNAMLDSFTPLGGLLPLWMIQLGEVIFGGIGSGLSGMLILVIVTVFVAGLMVGRTPEYLGKKIEPFEMKMASIAVLIMPVLVLILTAVALMIPAGVAGMSNPGAHGFTEILYGFSSMVNNNGSAFAGLSGNTPFYNIVGAIAMLIGRYWIAIPTLAIAGTLVRKKKIPSTLGTLPTHTPLFILLLISVTLILGALTFFPALALGPIVEQLMLWGHHGH